jgi:hypothetical protein
VATPRRSNPFLFARKKSSHHVTFEQRRSFSLVLTRRFLVIDDLFSSAARQRASDGSGEAVIFLPFSKPRFGVRLVTMLKGIRMWFFSG